MNTSSLIRNNFRLTLLASVVALGAFGASSSFAADATTTATGTVIEPITIGKSADLVFGKFAPGAGGSVTVSTSGARTGSGVILSSVGSSPTAAKFDVAGDNDATYSISWSGAVLTHATDTLQTMELARISEFTAGGATTPGDVTAGLLSSTGAQSIFLGGTLTVDLGQVAGNYAGDVTATVEYN